MTAFIFRARVIYQ